MAHFLFSGPHIATKTLDSGRETRQQISQVTQWCKSISHLLVYGTEALYSLDLHRSKFDIMTLKSITGQRKTLPKKRTSELVTATLMDAFHFIYI